MSIELQVRTRTTNSHVMQYGDMSHKQELLFAYMGADLSTRSLTSTSDISSPSISSAVKQRDTKLLYLQQKVSALLLFWIPNFNVFNFHVYTYMYWLVHAKLSGWTTFRTFLTICIFRL